MIPKYDYTVEYYVEVEEADKDDTAIKVGDKWYNRKSDETKTLTAFEGTQIIVGVNENGAGVLEDNTEVDDTFKTFDIYGYSSTATTENNKNSGTVSATGLTIQVLYDKNTTTYNGEYYLELEDQNSDDYDKLITINGKETKFKLDTSYTSSAVSVDSTATIIDKKADYADYELVTSSNVVTTYPSEVADIDDNGGTTVYQIYTLKPKYTVKYYLEVSEDTEGAKEVNGKYYQLQSDKTFTKATENRSFVSCYQINGTGEAGVFEVEPDNIIADSVQGFTGYEFNIYATAANTKHAAFVQRGGENLIELFYDLLPSYTVKYYVEVKATEKYDVSVDVNGNVKYYVVKTEETYEKEALTGTTVAYGTDNGEAGVKENGTNVDETFKSFDKYDFNDTYTVKNNKITGTVSSEKELVIELFYNKKLTDYTEKYYIEVTSLPDDGSETDTIGDKTYKVLTNKVEDVPIDTRVEITDKSDIYEGYKLLDSTTDKPWIVEDIDDNGQSVVYQVYDLPTYEIKYYKEVASNIEGAIEVDGKYYVLQSEDTVVNKATSGTEISSVKKGKETVTVKEGYTAVVNKSYDKYEFSQTSTDERGNASLTVSKDGENVVELFFDLLPKYTVNYYVEVKEGEAYDVKVGDGEEAKYYIIKETLTNETSTDTEVEYDTDNGEAGVMENGSKIVDTFKSFLGFGFSDSSTTKNNKISGTTSRLSELIIELFFDKDRTSYTEKYLVEVVTPEDGDKIINIDGVDYKEYYTNEVKGVYADSKAEIDDKSDESPYTGYELITPPTGYPSKVDDIDDEGKTIVYQVYSLPSYTVKYYKEVLENTDGAIKVGEKYYVLQNNDTVVNKATYGTTVEYLKKDATTAVVTEGTVEKSNTLKSYDKYEFSVDATTTNNKSKTTITKNAENVIELFYDIERTKYTEKYLIEVVDPAPSDEVIEIEGVTYKVVESTDITDIPVVSRVEITDKSDETPYVEYELVPSPEGYPSKVDDIEDDGTTVVYQIYRLHPDYTVKYYKEVLEDTEGAVKVGNKFYVLQSNDTVVNKAPSGTVIKYFEKDTATAGVTENNVEKNNTLKSYDKYEFSAEATELNTKTTTTISRDAENVVELFYDIERTKYIEKYLIEVVDPAPSDEVLEIEGVTYKVVESTDITDIPVDSSVEITDKSDETPYVEYELVPSPEGYPSKVDDIEDDGTTVVYQIYQLKPEYSVKYYLEADETTEGAVKVGNKYYVLQSDDTFTKEASTGTVVTYVSTDDYTAGVKEGNSQVTDTLKKYDKYLFSNDVTVANANTTGTLERGTEVVIELFYNKIKTEYKELYWVEEPDATDGYVEIEVNGEVKKFVLSETNSITDVNAGTNVTVTDKSADYSNYDLVEVEIPSHPTSSNIKEDGTTEVHQIYVLKPTYEVQYYVEVENKTDDSIEIDGKYYVLKSEESITKYASAKTLVSTATNTNGAGVKEADVEVADTFKSFDGYTFNQTATDAFGKNGGEVKSDNSLVIMLMYDLNEVLEEPTTPEESTTKAPTKPSTPVSTGDNVSMSLLVILLCSGCIVAIIMAGKKKTAKEQ